jgi:hypothetical protein
MAREPEAEIREVFKELELDYVDLSLIEGARGGVRRRRRYGQMLGSLKREALIQHIRVSGTYYQVSGNTHSLEEDD